MKRSPISRKSPKRKKEDKLYEALCRKVDRSHTDKADNVICFFCEQAICDVDEQDVKWKIDHHHLLKRDEHFLTERYLVPAHPKCHMQDYHVVEDADAMFDRPWFGKFLFHIRDGEPAKYNEYIRKYEARKGKNPTYRGKALSLVEAKRE